MFERQCAIAERNIEALIDPFGDVAQNEDGGFVFNTRHNIQGNTPPENVEAVFKARKESCTG